MAEKIRVLHIITSFNRAGAESVVINICNGLDKDLFKQSILTLKDEITAEKKLNNKTIAISSIGGVPIEIKNNLPRIRLSYLRTLIIKIKEIKPDIIHYHLIEGVPALILPYIKNKVSAKHIVTIHTKTNHYNGIKLNDKFNKAVERFSLLKSKATTIAVSYDMLEFLQRNLRMKDINCIRNGIDTGYYSCNGCEKIKKEEIGAKENDLLIIHIGRLNKIKNQEVILRAMQIVSSVLSNVKLMLVGQRGGDENYYRALVKSLSIEDKVLFLGEYDDIRPLAAIADLGVFPSRREGLSLALLEMMSMQLPVIVSDIHEFREVYEGITEPLFVPVDNYQALAEKILVLLGNVNYRKELGIQMRKQVEEKFNSAKQVESYSKIYNKLCNELQEVK